MANEQYEIYQQGTAAALAEVQLALLNSKASPDASYPSLSAGSATGITGDVETSSWMARQTNADGAALIESVKGNTLRWNQLLRLENRTVTDHGINMVASDGKATLSGTADGQVAIRLNQTSVPVRVTAGHKFVAISAARSTGIYISIDGIGSLYSDAVYTASTGGNRLSYLIVPTGTTTGLTIYPKIFDLTQMFGAGNEPSTVAEFEALFPEPYYPYDSGSLLPVRMEGIETVGFNQWDEVWERGSINWNNGEKESHSIRLRSANYIPVFPSTEYCFTGTSTRIFFYDADKAFVDKRDWTNSTFTTPAGAHYMLFTTADAYGSTYKDDICINLSDPSRNGTYEPYWRSERAIAASTYFPDGMRSAGSVRDELTATQAITRVGAVDLGTLTWMKNNEGQFFADLPTQGQPYATNHICVPYETSAHGAYDGNVDKSITITDTKAWIRDAAYTNAATFKAAMSGVMLYYALATPVTTLIDPPLPMSYRVGAGGTERVMAASGTTSAPPIFATRYPLDPADLAASIAPVDGPTAKTNHQVGDLLMLGFTLCKATQVIVTGETIAIGTNVTRTTVAAELAALSE